MVWLSVLRNVYIDLTTTSQRLQKGKKKRFLM